MTREILAWESSAFSLDGAVRVMAQNRAGLKRLLRDRAQSFDVGFVEYGRQSWPNGRCLVMADR
jgi:hypothetical protein